MTLDKNVIFILLLSQTIWSWYSKTSPQTLHLLPRLLASSGAFLAFLFCSSISSCFLSPLTTNDLFGLLTDQFVNELMNFVLSLQSTGASCSLNFSCRSSSCLVEFLLRLRSSHFIVLPDLFLNLLFHVNQSFPKTLSALAD